MNSPILIICTSLNMGGSEKQAVWLANSLVNEKKEVLFVSLKDSGILSFELDSKVLTYNFKLGKSKNIISKLFYMVIGIKNLIRIINENNITKIISFLFHSNVIARILTIFVGHKYKHIVTFRSDRLSKRDSQESRLRTWIFKHFVLEKNVTVVFNSHSGFNRMKSLKIDKKIILNTPLNSPNGIHKEENSIIYIGRFDELKNVNNIVCAMKHVNDKKLTLNIFGSGPDLPKLNKSIIKHNLESKVFINTVDPEISNKLNNYDALILGSTHEAFPNVIIEAMNSGIVPIATKAGDCEWLLTGEKGIIIQGYGPEEIADGINQFSNLSEKDKLKIVSNCKNFVKNELNENKILNQWFEILS